MATRTMLRGDETGSGVSPGHATVTLVHMLHAHVPETQNGQVVHMGSIRQQSPGSEVKSVTFWAPLSRFLVRTRGKWGAIWDSG